MTKMAAMPIYGKNPLKISETGRPISTKLGMYNQGLNPIKVCSNDDPQVTLTYFMARSNLVIFAACDLKVGRCRQQIDIMKVCE